MKRIMTMLAALFMGVAAFAQQQLVTWSSHVEKAVCKLQGIKNVNVNLLSNSMVVEYDEKYLNNQAIIKAVIDAGYGAKESMPETKNLNKTQQIQENDNTIKTMKKRVITLENGVLANDTMKGKYTADESI